MIREELVKKIMNDISGCFTAEFGINVDYDDEDTAPVYNIRHIIWNNYKAEVYNGVTKCVIVLNDEDEVIKLPFNGKFEEYFNDEEDQYDIDFIHFEFANTDVEDANTTWDYCENEYIKYEKAVEAGFADFLLETHYHGLICGMPVYTQEKAETFWDSQYSDPRSLSQDATDEYENSLHGAPMNRIWVIRAIAYYGVTRVMEFINWARKNGLAGDLHTGNIGFTTSGRPIILDWAGYRE